MRDEISIGEFLGSKCTNEDILLRPLQGAISELSDGTISPRAAVHSNEKYRSLPHELKMNAKHTKVNGEDWYNWDPTPLPSPTQHNEGWSSPVVTGMHKYNVVCDGLLALPTASNGKHVLFGFQAKEWMESSSAKDFRKQHLDHMTRTVAGCNGLDQYHFVRVLVEAEIGKNSLQLEAERDQKIEEAIVSGIHTLKWCPMVAYSSSSARVFRSKC